MKVREWLNVDKFEISQKAKGEEDQNDYFKHEKIHVGLAFVLCTRRIMECMCSLCTPSLTHTVALLLIKFAAVISLLMFDIGASIIHRN